MQTVQASTLQSLRAVRAFLDEHAGRLDGVANSGSSRKLDELIAQLSEHVVTQMGSQNDARVSTGEQYALRKALIRDHLTPLARIAQGNLSGVPGIETMRMPKRRIAAEKFAAAARGMAETAAQHADVFTAAGLPADFVERINAAVDAMLEALATRTRKRGMSRGATTGIKGRLSEGRRTVGILDALIQSKLAGDDALLAYWNRVKRVQNISAGRPAVLPAPATAPAPTASPVTLAKAA